MHSFPERIILRLIELAEQQNECLESLNEEICSVLQGQTDVTDLSQSK